jgi:hypothetical protein
MHGRVQASHLEGRPVQRGKRARDDRGREALCGERAQQERVSALEGEAKWLTGVGEALFQHGGDGRAAAGRDDCVPAEVSDADVRSRWGAVGGERGDHLVLAHAFEGEVVGDFAGQQAEGGVELVGGEEAKHVGGDALAQADLDAGVRLAEAGELATADAGGRPWASPVWFAHEGYRDFYWVSRPEARHSRNIEERPEIAITIFDSGQTPGDGRAVYMTATAGRSERGLEIFNARSVEQGQSEWTQADVTGDAAHRLYRATASEWFVLERERDVRVPVEPATSTR